MEFYVTWGFTDIYRVMFAQLLKRKENNKNRWGQRREVPSSMLIGGWTLAAFAFELHVYGVSWPPLRV